MAEYIERDDALNAIERSYWTEGAYERVERLPAADVVEVRHGRWERRTIEEIDLSAFFYRCSSCGKNARYNFWKFCPNCGARMDGE